tara:strand:+ start:161 stop:775 length:615 start_codon:yes stop_codon:yes gene_type:complete
LNNEGKFWSIVVIISFAALLFIVAEENGYSFMDIFSSEEKDDETNENSEIIEEKDNETNENSEITNSSSDPDPISRDCLDHDGLARHDHAVLKIFINGEQELIPANIGIMTEICNQQGEEMHAVHTHDSSGRLHIESNEPIDIPIGVFFDIWGQHFDETGIFEYRVNSTHELVMTVGNNTVDSYDDYLLVNTSEVIEIRYQSRE